MAFMRFSRASMALAATVLVLALGRLLRWDMIAEGDSLRANERATWPAQETKRNAKEKKESGDGEKKTNAARKNNNNNKNQKKEGTQVKIVHVEDVLGGLRVGGVRASEALERKEAELVAVLVAGHELLAQGLQGGDSLVTVLGADHFVERAEDDVGGNTVHGDLAFFSLAFDAGHNRGGTRREGKEMKTRSRREKEGERKARNEEERKGQAQQRQRRAKGEERAHSEGRRKGRRQN